MTLLSQKTKTQKNVKGALEAGKAGVRVALSFFAVLQTGSPTTGTLERVKKTHKLVCSTQAEQGPKETFKRIGQRGLGLGLGLEQSRVRGRTSGAASVCLAL